MPKATFAISKDARSILPRRCSYGTLKKLLQCSAASHAVNTSELIEGVPPVRLPHFEHRAKNLLCSLSTR